MKYSKDDYSTGTQTALCENTARLAGALLSEISGPGTQTSLSTIARSIDSTPQEVNDLLHSLKRRGLIDLARGRVIVKNEKNLRALSNISPGY